MNEEITQHRNEILSIIDQIMEIDNLIAKEGKHMKCEVHHNGKNKMYYSEGRLSMIENKAGTKNYYVDMITQIRVDHEDGQKLYYVDDTLVFSRFPSGKRRFTFRINERNINLTREEYNSFIMHKKLHNELEEKPSSQGKMKI